MFLLMSICLIADPGRCREERINISAESLNMMICLSTAQSTLAHWAMEHPAWSVRKWRCAAKGTLPNDL